ncbi:MAG: threonine synthase [Saprospiraceae bacterium]|nr:threonine synthase [Saprospiraceae bacterium]
MKLYSTRNPNVLVDLETAVFKGLADDKGLYLPEKFIPFAPSFFDEIEKYSFQELCLKVCEQLFQGEINSNDLKAIVNNAITFDAPLVKLEEGLHILELFHGPTLAFKDFGARFMAQLLSYLNKDKDKKTTILVATSGDTGGAVASGFFNVPNIDVIILYPSGKVSPLQEKQLTTLGGNITALEVDGTFDDCQSIVKRAFLDNELSKKFNLCSANSINIARLIPQSFYYFEAYKQLENKKDITFIVPSGNFGNLTAGIFANKLGLPVRNFIAATNENDIIPKYLSTGLFEPKPSIQTISNAMDVGNPSNFERLLSLFGSTWNNEEINIESYSINDKETQNGIKNTYNQYRYLIDPHTAVGYEVYLKNKNKISNGIILSTAHPSKFDKNIYAELASKIEIPERLSNLEALEKNSINISIEFNDFKDYLNSKG